MNQQKHRASHVSTSLKGQLSLTGVDAKMLEKGSEVRRILRDLMLASRVAGIELAVHPRTLGKLVCDLREALTSHEPSAVPPSRVWTDPSDADIAKGHITWRHDSPVDANALTAVAGAYLQQSVSSRQFEYYLLVGFMC